VYFGLTTIITLLVRLTERRYLVYLRPQNFATLAKS
jgi:histidine transport system permease protein/arginine/ornithine transport system permease protein